MSGLGGQVAGCRIEGAGCRVSGLGCRLQGVGLRVQGVGGTVALRGASSFGFGIPRACGAGV